MVRKAGAAGGVGAVLVEAAEMQVEVDPLSVQALLKCPIPFVTESY